jgi:hypothetical protein
MGRRGLQNSGNDGGVDPSMGLSMIAAATAAMMAHSRFPGERAADNPAFSFVKHCDQPKCCDQTLVQIDLARKCSARYLYPAPDCLVRH